MIEPTNHMKLKKKNNKSVVASILYNMGEKRKQREGGSYLGGREILDLKGGGQGSGIEVSGEQKRMSGN